MMRALTLRHPWPWVINRLGKRIENRGFVPHCLAIGEWFALHGGSFPRGREYESVEALACELALKTGYTRTNGRPTNWLITGIFAVCRFGGVVPLDSDDPWYDKPPSRGWKLDNLLVLPIPIPCRGAQGIWKVPDEIEDELRKLILANGR